MGVVEDPEDAVLHLPSEVASVAEARAFVADAVRRWGIDPPEALPLLTSEVVTNAVVHTDGQWVVIRVCRAGDLARVEVRDRAPDPPQVRELDPRAPGGFGMWLVEQLARAWGVSAIAEDGKVVWFELDLSPSPA
ncbi:MAG TPA: ATP-binding protein [Aquihabitans sp.]|jgi:anti-sigma regulatory factor (Ser/Thr protein kinase)|nr:ATP-binding protein [Aquihabitans sp.]